MGLRNEDLKNLVLPIISIDEFEPKIGTNEEVIVVAFYCKDELPAYDLEDFMDKGVVEFLDSEVSPNPDKDGNYVVFVEFKRQPNFWTKLFKLLKDVERATGPMKWKAKPYLSDTAYDLLDKELHQYVITRSDEYMPRAEFSDDPETYLKDSDLTSLDIGESTITFGRQGQKIVFDYTGFGDTEAMTSKLNLNEAYVDVMATSSALTNLRSMLGEGWDVSAVGQYYFITKHNDNQSLVVRRR